MNVKTVVRQKINATGLSSGILIAPEELKLLLNENYEE